MANALIDGSTGHDGHHDVENDQVGLEDTDVAEELQRIFLGMDDMSLVGQKEFEGPQNIRVIVNNQNTSHSLTAFYRVTSYKGLDAQK
jgi:hypothetical protein